MLICGTAGFVEQQEATIKWPVPLLFLLAPGSGVSGCHQCSHVGKTETSPSDSPLKRQNIRCVLQLSLFPRSQELGIYSCLLHVVPGEKGSGRCIHVYIVFHCHLCSQYLPTWYPFLSALRFGKDRNQSLGQSSPPELESWTHSVQLFSFFPEVEFTKHNWSLSVVPWVLQSRNKPQASFPPLFCSH